MLFGTEPHRPYERPPLSKGYLDGSSERATVFVHPPQWYAEQRRRAADRHHGDRPSTAHTHEVVTGDGSRLRYDKLLLATGATPRPLPVPGADGGVRYLRSLDDSDGLRSAFTPGTRVVIVGGGWIGLEAAAAARAAGAEVTVLENAELPLLRVLGPEVARVFADLHTDHGVDLRCGVTVAAVRTAARFGRAPCCSATAPQLDADVVVAGVGVAPRVELAVAAGLRTDNGVLVDEHLRTSDPDIVAAGDVANAYHPLLGRYLRVEHWANALNQPAVAAATMLGRPAVYDRLPYFFTDQYDLGMEYTGHAEPGGYDEVVIRGDLGAREFVAFWLLDGRVQAGMNVNVWDVTDPIAAMIRSGVRVDADRLADLDVPFAELARR